MHISTINQIYEFEGPKWEGVQRDMSDFDIVGEVSFLKHAPPGQQGDSETYIKAVGNTYVECRNTESITVIKDDGSGTEVALTPGNDSGPDIEDYDASSYVTQGKIPTLALKYVAGQTNEKKGCLLYTSPSPRDS